VKFDILKDPLRDQKSSFCKLGQLPEPVLALLVYNEAGWLLRMLFKPVFAVVESQEFRRRTEDKVMGGASGLRVFGGTGPVV
jgi:hypothetical protein